MPTFKTKPGAQINDLMMQLKNLEKQKTRISMMKTPISEDIIKYKDLSHSWVVRVNIGKMAVLPKVI